MALFMKQDFTPPLLSRRWFAIKFRPNMLIYSREHIISILESGLLFREDSIEVEQEAPSQEEVWLAAGGGKSGWFTRGEAVLATAVLGGVVFLFPPRSVSRVAAAQVCVYASLPAAVRAGARALCRGRLAALLHVMRDYLALARRAAACLKEYAALHAQLGSLTSIIESTHTLLCRQQSELSILMSRASSALLGNAPWLHADVAWDAVARDHTDNLMKIHHAFLVVQSTLLKHIAMAHYVPSPHARKLYKNHNERIYWIHTVLIQHLVEEFRQNYEALERMYRLLKNSGNKEVDVNKKLGTAVNKAWLCSDVHTGVARACLELKLALQKGNNLDIFLDSCALNNQNLDLEILNKDIEDLIDDVTKCLATLQSSQIRLKKLRGKVDEKPREDVEIVEDNSPIVKIDDRVPESKDEVFYFVKTDDDAPAQSPGDVTTAPGKQERETTKIVLTELKRKLGKREDLMRERERQALTKTMPGLKDIPDFPRQIKFEEFVEKKGYLPKLERKVPKKKLFRHYKIRTRKHLKTKKYVLKIEKYASETDIPGDVYEANAKLNVKSKLITFYTNQRKIAVVRWRKKIVTSNQLDSSGLSEGLSDVEASAANTATNQATNELSFKVSKKDLELSSSSESDFEFHQVLNDARKTRAVWRKKHPVTKRVIDNGDESLRPIEYSFGTGLAMASVLQINSKAQRPNMAQEEVFMGDGEVSTDSGNDEDA
ncbi:hypothetical protein O3G_MSEX012159 [Manduca sexta]|uniref:Uncharacterized protein n=1 Tax=Manduca sexta TaxID=7130 RepID=A0A921ZNU3_MANSE|nr:hypothetical protein O3G_MSEX012159 [Manduca sexta]KAG6460688.1 hypothetical protein O3G_MSEX012159 [Manduca sexta]